MNAEQIITQMDIFKHRVKKQISELGHVTPETANEMLELNRIIKEQYLNRNKES